MSVVGLRFVAAVRFGGRSLTGYSRVDNFAVAPSAGSPVRAALVGASGHSAFPGHLRPTRQAFAPLQPTAEQSAAAIDPSILQVSLWIVTGVCAVNLC